MRERGLWLSVLFGLGLVLALAWVLQGTTAQAAPVAQGPSAVHLRARPEEGEGGRLPAAPAAPAATIHVCPAGPPTCDYSSIQAAVDAAASGATILVASGFYTGVQQRGGITQVVYITKSLTIRGGYTLTNWIDPDPLVNMTWVDAQTSGRVMVISGSITVHIEGLYIAGGDATGLGGGVGGYDGVGGGLYVVDATVTISDCTFDGNVASSSDSGSGGGIYLWNATATVVNNELLSNVASESGSSTGYGGGIAISGGIVTLEGNYIHSNAANGASPTAGPGSGGGIYIASGSPTLKRNRIEVNVAGGGGSYGGGIYIDAGAQPALVNNVLIDNVLSSSPTDSGAGIYVAGLASPRLLHTTIANNTGGDGSGVYVGSNGTAVLTNSIIVSQAKGVVAGSNSDVTINGVLWYGNGQNRGGLGTISVQNEITGTPAFDIDGYHILSSSAALDAGVVAGVAEDIDGQDRHYGTKPDLGADEWRPTPVSGVLILGSDIGFPNFPNFFTGLALPYDAAPPITYTWSPTPDGGQGTAWVTYTWATTGTYVITLTAQNATGSAITTTTITIRTDLTTTLYPTAEVTLIYTDPWGLTTTLYAPAGAVTQSLTLRYVPQVTYAYTLPQDWGFGDHAFDLEVLSNGLPLQGFVFSQPLTITVNYTDSDILGLDENTLRLYFWDGSQSQWVDGATTCVPTSTYHLYTQENRLELAICHLSRWGMMGMGTEEERRYIYLPLVLRNYP